MTGPPDVGPTGSPLLSIGTSVSEKARTVKGSVVEENRFSRPHPKRNDLCIPCLKHRGFPVRFLEPCGMFHAHLHTSSRSSKHLLLHATLLSPTDCAAILLELPGGGVSPSEDPAEAAARELLEETGYRGEMELAGSSWHCGYSTRRTYHLGPL